MVRSVFAAAAAFAVTIAVIAGLHGSVVRAARPQPTPTPVALQYEQITRMVLPPASPPAPGTFSDDRQGIMSAASAPAPQHHGMFGGIMNGMNSAMSAMSMMRTGTLTRYTYYRNWLRTDDPVAQTATIEKCDLHQYITLDLAKHTYTITSTLPAPQPAPAPGVPGGRSVENERPGTVDMTFTATHTNLGPRVIENIPTHGDSTVASMVMTNATGSCSDGSMSMQIVEYVSNVGIPRRYCPLPRVSNMPASPEQMVVHGGCKPHFHGGASGMGGMMGSGNHLAMYRLMSAGGAQTNGQSFKTLTEAGNVRWLYRPEAEALFSIPPGFTRTQ